MKVFYLEDHEFYAEDVIALLQKEGHDVVYASSYKECLDILENETFDCAILDVILQNGKTGLQLAEDYGDKLGRIMFLTGCVDKATIDTVVSRYPSANKLFNSVGKIREFLKGGKPTIDNEAEIMGMNQFSM